MKKIIASLILISVLGKKAPAQTSDSLDVIHYSFDLLLSDSSDTLRGDATVVVHFLQAVHACTLDLSGNMFVSSVVMATLFFGGYDIPFFNEAEHWGNAWWAGLIGFAVLMTKAVIFIFIFMWIRWTIPRFRYDQLMNLGWKKLIPLALLNMIITAVVMLLLNK